MTKVAIVGRPNVGKSTLFNRLAGKKLALVDDRPGVTRDRRETIGSLGTLKFSLMDTAGFHYDAEEKLVTKIQEQIYKAIEWADVLFFVVDSRHPITPEDQTIAQILRMSQKPILLLANKAEGSLQKSSFYETYGLGLGDPLPISAEHGQGISLLYEAFKPYWTEEETETDKKLQLVILGRPNAGKSTLLNQYLKEYRVVTGETPGLTRDAIAVEWAYQGIPLRLIDTAGLRKKAKIIDRVEKLSTGDTLKSLQYAHVAILLIDATCPLERQDLTIARQVVEEGRILIIGLNKWDLIETQKEPFLASLKRQLSHVLAQVKDVPFIPISAEKGTGIYKLLDQALGLYELWNKRLPTAQLNKWLKRAEEEHLPPLVGKNRLRLKYITQVKSRPPTFVLFSNQESEFPDSYKRYLENSLRKYFGLPGIPLRLTVKKSHNPYTGNSL